MEAYRLRNPGDEGDGEEGDGSGGEKKGEEGDADDYELGAVLDDELQRDGDAAAAAARGGGSSSNGAGPSGVHGQARRTRRWRRRTTTTRRSRSRRCFGKSGAVHTHRQDKVLGGAALRPELEAEAAAQAEAAGGGGAGGGGGEADAAEASVADALGGCVSFYEYMTQLRGGSDGLRDPMARLLLRLHDDDPDRLEALVDAVNGLPQGGVMVRG